MKDTPATRKDIDDILQVLRGFIQQTDERFNLISFQMNERFDKIETEIIDLKTSHNHLLNTIDTFIARIDHYETEQAARDSQFEKLLAWACKVSEKTGIPLENL